MQYIDFFVVICRVKITEIQLLCNQPEEEEVVVVVLMVVNEGVVLD